MYKSLLSQLFTETAPKVETDSQLGGIYERWWLSGELTDIDRQWLNAVAATWSYEAKPSGSIDVAWLEPTRTAPADDEAIFASVLIRLFGMEKAPELAHPPREARQRRKNCEFCGQRFFDVTNPGNSKVCSPECRRGLRAKEERAETDAANAHRIEELRRELAQLEGKKFTSDGPKTDPAHDIEERHKLHDQESNACK